jgi:hypothetical protein
VFPIDLSMELEPEAQILFEKCGGFRKGFQRAVYRPFPRTKLSTRASRRVRDRDQHGGSPGGCAGFGGFDDAPLYWAKLFFRGCRRGFSPRDRFLSKELTGSLSGFWYYLTQFRPVVSKDSWKRSGTYLSCMMLHLSRLKLQ